MIKCFVTDLDGTLLLDHKPSSTFDLSDRSIEAIEVLKKHNIKRYIASGRTAQESKRIQRLLKEEDVLIATLNGAAIYDNGDFPLVYDFKNEDIDRASNYLESLKKYLNSYSAVTINGKRIFKVININMKDKYLKDYGVDYAVINGDFKAYDTVCKMLIHCIDGECGEIVVNHLNNNLSDRFEVSRSAPSYVELTLKNANKGNIIKYLMNVRGYKYDEIAVFGDGENDIPMLKEVKYAYVMKQGIENVKQYAYKVVDDVLDGVLDCVTIK